MLQRDVAGGRCSAHALQKFWLQKEHVSEISVQIQSNPSFLAFKDRVAHGLQGCLLSECYLGTAWMSQQNLSQRFPVADVAEENRGFLFRPLSPKQLCCIVLHCAALCHG